MSQDDEIQKKINSFPSLEGRVLIVEDEETNQLLFARILQKFGCKCQAVSNGKEAIEALKINEYDLILMDCQMPVMDGYAATRIIRNDLSKIPIVALTANAVGLDREKCIEVGMNDYLSKPASQAKLHEILSKYLKHK